MNKCIFMFFVILSWAVSVLAVDGYAGSEIFDHSDSMPNNAYNNAVDHYNYQIIRGRYLEIPPLMQGQPPSVGISLRTGVGLHNHFVEEIGTSPLSLQTAALLALRREDMEIPIEFQNIVNLRQAAAGGYLDEDETDALRNALRGGGYLTPLAALVYNITQPLIGLNFSLCGEEVQFAREVVLHIRLLKRVSKNVKELSHHSIYNANVHTLKRIIDDQYAFCLRGPPHSCTVLSYDELQQD